MPSSIFRLLIITIILLYPATICKADIAAELLTRYHTVARECVDGKHGKLPLYDCLGIILIAVEGKSPPWLLSADNNGLQKISGSFMHTSTPIYNLYGGFVSGIVVSPPSKTPTDRHKKIDVLCVFPVDANSNQRLKDNGCTGSAIEYYPDELLSKSGFCDDQKVTTVDQWMEHAWYDNTDLGHSMTTVSQCAFRMTGPNANKNFQLNIDVIQRLGQMFGGYVYNEVLFRDWGDDLKKMPIEAIYHISGSKKGHEEAWHYHTLYLSATGIHIPVVEITLPTKTSDIIIKKSANKAPNISCAGCADK